MSLSSDTRAKRDERTVFLLLTVALFPMLAIAIVVTYGFAVWVIQMISGPPGA